MNKYLYVIAALLLSAMSTMAASRGDGLLDQAKANYAKKDYTPARYYFKEALNAYVSEKNPQKAVEAGVAAAQLFHRENYYKEAFEMLSRADAAIGEQVASGNPVGGLYYDTSRERLEMYIKLKNSAKARESLDRMAANVGQDASRAADLLYNEAAYAYAFGNNRSGDEAINKLVSAYEREASYEKADSSFRALIDRATASKNARLLNNTYARYNQWTDSMKMLRTQEQLDQAADEVAARDAKIEELDHTIGVKNAIVVTLGVVIAILIGALVIVSIILIRYMVKSRKLRQNLDTALDHTRLKDAFIHNILSQMQPTIETLPANHPAAEALKKFASDVQLLSDLETSVKDLYETEDINVLQFCETLADEVRPRLAEGVTLTVSAPKMNARLNAEETANVLRHILVNAALNTPEGGKITLEFKKRGPHSAQFMITDTGRGISEDRRDSIFRPFSKVRDLTKGNGLGLPISAIKARKLNGTLTLDRNYTNGARFILDIRS